MRTALVVLSFATAAVADDGLKLPPGFAVTQFAGPDLAPDAYTLHIDAGGRVHVAGPGYIRELTDADGNGVADAAVDLVTGLKNGPMGLLREGDDLYFVADGGLKHLRLTPGKPADATSARTLVPLKTGGEHDTHAVRRGPDGDLYLLCGNMSGVTAKTVRGGTSPVVDPVAGCLLRLSSDASRVQVVADGFRNAYDFDFDARGEPCTFDSDNERCVSLPWYEPTRFYHVVPGGNYGWRSPQRSAEWRVPPEAWDVVPPAAIVGRGSPTGVASYLHAAFPSRYRGGFFVADWTFGKVWFVPLRESGSTWTGVPEPFLTAVGSGGFAPTGLGVHPTTGELFVSTGGRSARGAVYRVRSTLHRQVEQRRPPRVALPAAGRDATVISQATSAASAFERRQALEQMTARVEDFSADAIRDAIRSNAGHADRLVRQATARLARTRSAEERTALLAACDANAARITIGFALPAVGLETGLDILAKPAARPADRLDACRLIQVSLGDLTAADQKGTAYQGYSPGRPVEPTTAERIAAVARAAFPTEDAILDRELLRLSAVVADPNPVAVGNALSVISPTTDLVDDIHALIVLSRLPATRTVIQRQQTADALIRLDAKAVGRNRDRNWPLRVSETVTQLFAHDADLRAALLRHPEFGRADHVLFAKLDGFDKPAAGRRFVAVAGKDADFAWAADHVRLLGSLPAGEVRDLLPALWERGGLEDELVPLFAHTPTTADRGKFRRGVRSSRPATVVAAANALATLPQDSDGEDVIALIRALKSLPENAADANKAVTATLRVRTGAEVAGTYAAWTTWATANAPAVAAKLAEAGDVAAARKRLADVEWAAGDAANGKRVFIKANCAACHNGNNAVGPTLDGVSKRFGRADLLTQILVPDAQIPARYRTTRVTTTDGRQYDGVILYDAVDGLMLQTGAADTVRVAGDRIESKTLLDKSLMPSGLLDPLSKREVADLFAYLQTLGGK